MNDSNQIIDQALGILRKRSLDGYEIYLDQSSHFEVEAKEGRVDTFEASHSWGMALRVLNHHRMGFSYTTSPDLFSSNPKDSPGRLERMIDDAVASAGATSFDLCFDFASVLKDLPHSPPIFDDTLEEIPEKVKIEKAKQLEEAVRSVDPGRIKKVRKASYQEVLSRKTLVNSHGLHFSYTATLASASVTAVAEAAGESEVGWDFDVSHFFNLLDVEKIGKSAAKKALERLGGKRVSSGVYPVLLHHHVASEFLSLLAHSFLADQVQKGKSFLKGKKGERCFSTLLNIVDDGTHPKGVSTSPIDGEGMPSQRTPLVVQGELSGYLYDRYWANRENSSSGSWVQSTGNSRRSGIKIPPSIGISNFFIEPGPFPLSNLMENLHQGLVVEEVMGLHTVDPISGNFSLGCSGDWIERGEKVFPVKSIAIAGNLFQFFKRVMGVGEDLRFFGGVGSPSLLVEKVEVSGN